MRSSPRLALRLAGLRVHSRLRAGSPGKARSAATRGMRRDECIGAASPRLALRLAGLRGYSRLRVGSPGKARSAASGECAQHEILLRSSSRLALRLAGLRVHSRLRVGSPGKARSAATRGMAAEALAQLDAALHHAQQVLPGPELAKPRLSQPSLQILNIVTLAVEHQADHAAAVRHVNTV